MTLASISRMILIAAAYSSSTVYSAPIPGQGTWETTLHARDINSDGIIDAYFDSSLNITWLANWNYLGITRNYEDLTGVIAPSLSILGVTGWRLPSALNSDGSGPCSGFNCTSSEIGHMWYVELGNTTGPATNTANFTNMQTLQYWTNTRHPNVFFAWKFSTEDGSLSTSATGFAKYAEFVRNGDVAVVPEPSTSLLLAGGLGLGMAWLRRRPRHSLHSPIPEPDARPRQTEA